MKLSSSTDEFDLHAARFSPGWCDARISVDSRRPVGGRRD
jgi:hypothetical protein